MLGTWKKIVRVGTSMTIAALALWIVLVQGNGKAVATLGIPTGMSKPGMAPGLRFVSSENKEYLIGVQGEIGRTLTVRPRIDRKLILSSR